MPKVKMSDIKSGSENVKDVFRATMTGSRRKKFVKQKFTNDELLEILDISENIEYHKEKRNMYQRLIVSQSGPFNAKVFDAYLDKLFDVDALLNLLENSKGISDESKLKWLDYLMVTSTHWAVFNYFSRDAGTSFGIDVTKPPFRTNYAQHIVKYADKMGRGNISQDYFNELHRILDTMSEGEIIEWYNDSVTSTYEKRAVDFLMSYDKMPGKVLQHYWNKTTLINKEKLALHPNIPEELREWMYQETQDEKYLPQAAKDLFLF
jgi:hypothetical protein